ncbi:Asp-tRNA(Asn)/Glu-tRNA(Gln) amidotransferase subunit GatC [Candidatus Kuenenbacteria bacterium]|nr:Asp-tRNA(Asn)/Glu-tRNA(Gln) amidotransferase subunit GatC [Candidatus Kuenenbacteria bacterium]
MSLDIHQIEHLANLARLELTAEEKELYTAQLAGILDYFRKLQELDTTGVEPTGQTVKLHNVFRHDDPKEPTGDIDKKIINNAPDKTGRHIRVKKIL